MKAETSQNDVRNKIQLRAVELSKINNHLVLEFATGSGKTLASIKIIEEILKSKPNSKGYLICKESTHIKNWEDDIKKHKKTKVLKNITSFLYASLHKYKDLVDFIILDECHAITDKRLIHLDKLITRNTKVIYLSATIPEEKKDFISILSGNSAKYCTITLMKAIKLGLLPPPSIIVHESKLSNNSKRTHVFTMNKGLKAKAVGIDCLFNERWEHIKKHKNLELRIKCNETEYYDLITGQMDFYSKSLSEGTIPYKLRDAYRNKFLNLGSQRKKFISKAKTNKALEILNEFKSNKNRFICFTGSVEQSNILGKLSSVNSKNTKEYNQELIDCFNDKKCSELYAVNMLREGINLTDIEKGLIIQLDSSIESYLQMLGRMLRSEFPEIHLIKLSNTQDEKYFETALIGFDEKYITYDKS